MPFNRPSLLELKQRVAVDLNAGLAGSDALLRRSNTNVLATIHAGGNHGLYGYLEWISEQKFATTAEEEALLIEGAEYGLTLKPGGYARGTATAVGTDGSVIAIDTLWQRGDGVEYRTTAAAVIAAGTAAVSIIAQVAGLDGNCAAGVTLSLVNPVDGVELSALVTPAGLLLGADIESIESFRVRVLERKRRKPAGGNKYDYVGWAKAVSGVADAWTVPCGQGPGTVDLLILADADITGAVIPTTELCAEVRAAIVLLCPEGVQFLRVLPPEPKDFDITLSVVPDTAAVRTAVTTELADLVARAAAAPPRLIDPVVTIPMSQINEAISLAADETDHTVTDPAAAVIFTAYELPAMGEITWL